MIETVIANAPGFFESACFLGVDLSLNKSGFAIMDAERRVLTGVMKPPKGFVGSVRLDWLDTQFAALLSHPWRRVAIEGYSLGNRFTRDHDLGECGGLFRLNAWRRGHPILVVPPKSLKKYVTGSGGNEIKKAQVIAAVKKLWHLDLTDDNEADAVVLMQMAKAHTESGFIIPTYQRDALDKAELILAKSVVTRSRTRPTP